MNIRWNRTAVPVAAALFLAALLTPAVLAAQDPHTPPPPGQKPPARMLPREALGLTPDQEKAIGEFRKARMEENRAFREEMRKSREEMRGLAQDPKADQKKIDGLIDKQAKLRADRAKAGFRNRAAFEKMFTPEQLEKMKAFRARFEGRPGPAGRGWHRGPGRGYRPMGPYRHFRRHPFYRWRW